MHDQRALLEFRLTRFVTEHLAAGAVPRTAAGRPDLVGRAGRAGARSPRRSRSRTSRSRSARRGAGRGARPGSTSPARCPTDWRTGGELPAGTVGRAGRRPGLRPADRASRPRAWPGGPTASIDQGGLARTTTTSRSTRTPRSTFTSRPPPTPMWPPQLRNRPRSATRPRPATTRSTTCASSRSACATIEVWELLARHRHARRPDARAAGEPAAAWRDPAGPVADARRRRP